MLRKKVSSSWLRILIPRVLARFGRAKMRTLRNARHLVRVKTFLLYFLKGLVGSFKALHSRPNAQEPRRFDATQSCKNYLLYL